MLEVIPDVIPQELRELPQWVVWRNKVPFAPSTGRAASSSDPSGWTDFRTAWAAEPSYDGVGFVLTANDPYVVIDLDHVLLDDGTLMPDAEAIVREMDTYTEISVSGTGLHLWLRGALPPGGCRKGAVEMYATARYMTVTGHHLTGTPGTIQDRGAELARMHARIFPPVETVRGTPRTPVPITLSDSELLDRARAAKDGADFVALYDRGDLSAHGGDHSRADLALVGRLAFWFGGDPGAIDRVFRSSALMREKWERRDDYRDRTIREALEGRTEFYTPRTPAGAPRTSGGPMTPLSNPGPVSGHPDGAAGDVVPDGAVDVQQHHVPVDAVHGDHREDHRGGDGAVDGADAIGDVQQADFHMTDLGNAERLIHRHGRDLMYVREIGWFVWTGNHWLVDLDGQVERRAHATARSILAEACDLQGKDERAARVKHSFRSESSASIASMIGMARTLHGVTVGSEQLDTDQWLLGVGNGVVDLRTGELRESRRDDRISKQAGADFDPTAGCPTWDGFLARVVPDPGARDFLRRSIGYSLTGHTSERCMFILFGKGRNGKTIFVETILSLLADYGKPTDTSTIMEKRDPGAIPNDLAALVGARFVAASEGAENQRLNESRVKAITSGDSMTARFMRHEYFTFSPVLKLWFSTNHRPRITGTDDAVWDRIRLIPFTERIADDEMIPRHDLLASLRAELSGILAWAVSGCIDWQRTGLQEPEAVSGATREYREESDILGTWITDCCEEGRQYSETAAALYASFKAWAARSGERERSQTDFGKAIGERGFSKDKPRSAWIYRGIRVRPDPFNTLEETG